MTDTTDETYRNEDGHSVDDLRPKDWVPSNIEGYLDAPEVVGIYDAHDEQTIARLDAILGLMEELAIELHTIDPTRSQTWLSAMTTICENSRDLAADPD